MACARGTLAISSTEIQRAFTSVSACTDSSYRASVWPTEARNAVPPISCGHIDGRMYLAGRSDTRSEPTKALTEWVKPLPSKQVL
jgi:hypothetical protein